MSMYNAIFGVNPYAGAFLSALDISYKDIARFRDCYVVGDEIIILTRTGGGNREEYQKENAALRKLTGYLRDEDDAFDQTYAVFFFAIPEELREIIDGVRKRGAEQPMPAERWKNFFDDLHANKKTQETERADIMGQDIAAQIAELLGKQGD